MKRFLLKFATIGIGAAHVAHCATAGTQIPLSGSHSVLPAVSVKVGILEATSSDHPTHSLAKRKEGEHYPAKTALSISGYRDKSLHIHLELDTDFISNDLNLLDHNPESKYNLTNAGALPRHLLCYYRGKVQGHHDSYVTLNMCGSPRGRIEVPGHGHLQLEPANPADSSDSTHTHKITTSKAPKMNFPTSRLHRRNNISPTTLVARILLAVDIDHVMEMGPWLMGALLGFMHAAATIFPGGTVPVYDNVRVKMQFTHIIRATKRRLFEVPGDDPSHNYSYLHMFGQAFMRQFEGQADMAFLLRKHTLRNFSKDGMTVNDLKGCLITNSISGVFNDLNEHAAWIFAHEFIHQLGGQHAHDKRLSSADPCRASEDIMMSSLSLTNLSECTLSDIRKSYLAGRFQCFPTLSAAQKTSSISTMDFEGYVNYNSKERKNNGVATLKYDVQDPANASMHKWALIARGIYKNYMKHFYGLWNFNLGNMLSKLTGFENQEGRLTAFENSHELDSYVPVNLDTKTMTIKRFPATAPNEFLQYRAQHMEPKSVPVTDSEFSEGNGLYVHPLQKVKNLDQIRQQFLETELIRRKRFHPNEDPNLYPIREPKAPALSAQKKDTTAVEQPRFRAASAVEISPPSPEENPRKETQQSTVKSPSKHQFPVSQSQVLSSKSHSTHSGLKFSLSTKNTPDARKTRAIAQNQETEFIRWGPLMVRRRHFQKK